MFQFPFGTLHQLNLDWFLQQWEIYKQEWADAQAGIDNALQGEIDRVEDAMTDLYNARDVAVQAKDDAQTAAGSALSDAGQAGTDALKSEGYAVGEQDGIPVGSGSPYYQDNAKYYKVEAGTYRYLSEAYAKGEMGGSPVAPGEAGYQDNAKYYKDAADLDASTASGAATSAGADALIAEGHAVGEQNGTPVSSGSPYYQNNAKYYSQQTAQDKSDTDTLKDAANAAALRAEGWSNGEQNGTPVSSGSPYYENNAKYYKEEAETVAASIPPDYTSLSNKVNTLLLPGYFSKEFLSPDFSSTVAGRTVSVSGNTLKSVFNSSSATKTNAYFTGSNHLVTTVSSWTGYTPPEDVFIELAKLKPSDLYDIVVSFRSEGSYTGAASSALCVCYAKIENNVVTVIENKWMLDDLAKGIKYRNLILTDIPNTATHFALFVYQSGPGSEFTAIFDISYAVKKDGRVIAPELSEMIADKNLVKNDFRIIGGQLYRVTTPVSAGSALSTSTNITATTIADVLKSLLP